MPGQSYRSFDKQCMPGNSFKGATALDKQRVTRQQLVQLLLRGSVYCRCNCTYLLATYLSIYCTSCKQGRSPSRNQIQLSSSPSFHHSLSRTPQFPSPPPLPSTPFPPSLSPLTPTLLPPTQPQCLSLYSFPGLGTAHCPAFERARDSRERGGGWLDHAP